MRSTKSIFASVLALVMTVSMLAGCGGGGGSTTDAGGSGSSGSGGTTISAGDKIEQKEIDESRTTTDSGDKLYEKLVIGLGDDPMDLQPKNVNAAGKKFVFPYIYEALFDFDSTHYYPVLAKSYEETDELYWDVELYDYIYDSAGNHITADDVIFCYDWIRGEGALNRSQLLDRVEKTGDYSLRFHWTAPVTGVCDLEWIWGKALIFSQKAFEEGGFTTNPVATGPYTVKSFTAGSGVTLERNPNYWQTDPELIALGHHANVETLDFQLMTEASQQVINLRNGAIDFSYSIPNENLSEFLEGGQYADTHSVYRTPKNGYYYIMGNMSEKSIWSDINFRKAFCYAMDNEFVSTLCSYPACTAIGTALWPEFYDAMSADTTYENTVDLDLARQYLDQSGYNGEEVVLIYWNESYSKAIAEAILAQMTALGVNFKIEVLAQEQAEALVAGPDGYDLFLSAGGGSSLVGGMNRMLNCADFGGYYAPGQLHDEELFERFNAVNNAANYNVENMKDFVSYVMDNAYLYALVYQVDNLVYTSDIAQVGYNHNFEFALGDCVFYVD